MSIITYTFYSNIHKLKVLYLALPLFQTVEQNPSRQSSTWELQVGHNLLPPFFPGLPDGVEVLRAVPQQCGESFCNSCCLWNRTICDGEVADEMRMLLALQDEDEDELQGAPTSEAPSVPSSELEEDP